MAALVHRTLLAYGRFAQVLLLAVEMIPHTMPVQARPRAAATVQYLPAATQGILLAAIPASKAERAY